MSNNFSLKIYHLDCSCGTRLGQACYLNLKRKWSNNKDNNTAERSKNINIYKQQRHNNINSKDNNMGEGHT